MLKSSNKLEKGLSDHHELVLTILKSGKFKGTPKAKNYRSYRKSNLENFNNILRDELETLPNQSNIEFDKVVLNELNSHAPLKNSLKK